MVKLWYYGKKTLVLGKKNPNGTIPKTTELKFTMEITMVLWKNHGTIVKYSKL